MSDTALFDAVLTIIVGVAVGLAVAGFYAPPFSGLAATCTLIFIGNRIEAQ